MQSQNPFTNGAWSFVLTSIVLIAFLMLGADLPRLNWLSRPIAEAQADQISKQTDIEYRNAELDYAQREFYVLLEMERAQKQVEQELQAQITRDAEALAYQQNIHAAMVFGTQFIAIVLAVGLFVASVLVGVGFYRYLKAKAQVDHTQPAHGRLIVKIEQLTRQVSALQEKAAVLEGRQNHGAKHAIDDMPREWPDDPEDYLSRLPNTWAG